MEPDPDRTAILPRLLLSDPTNPWHFAAASLSPALPETPRSSQDIGPAAFLQSLPGNGGNGVLPVRAQSTQTDGMYGVNIRSRSHGFG